MSENVLYYGNNLKVLRVYIPDNSIDLICIDPPFNSNAGYNIIFKEPVGDSSKAQITAFEDSWHWTEETERIFQDIVNNSPAEVVEMMRAFLRFVGRNDIMAYLTMMCIRLVELRRVLKDTGSIYLHCDPTASHYLKILMDTIFGKNNFRNEIVWCYRGAGYPKKDFGRRHDIIFRYSKGENYFVALGMGSYHSEKWGRDFPRLQIFTIEDLLLGKKPKIPQSLLVYKRAQIQTKPNQLEIDND